MKNCLLMRFIIILLSVFMIISITGCDAIERGIKEGIEEANKNEPAEETTESTAEPATRNEQNEDEEELKVLHGVLLDVIINDDNVAVVKTKIQPSYNNKATIDQNYYNVVDLIRNHEFNQYDEIQYWAVADMSDGSEQKVISFSVTSDVIKVIADAEAFADNTLGDYLTDLWVHPSLTD